MRGNTNSESSQGNLVGQVVDGHDIVRLLGTGGMGDVYLARHCALGMQRAIKVIRDDHKANAQVNERFKREAISLSRLQHPNIVGVIDFGRLPNGWPFLCMEYIEGCDLSSEVESNGPMPFADALQVLWQLAGALAYAHKQRIVHRDLKPGNVILRDGDVSEVKIIDFGLASIVSGEMLTRLTRQGQVLGSPLYMAPEQADGSLDITGAADVYSLAGIAYMLLSGEPVFPGRSLLELIAAHTSTDAVHLGTRCPDLPERFDELIFACLRKQANTRPSAAELEAHLGEMVATYVGTVEPPAFDDETVVSTQTPAPVGDEFQDQTLVDASRSWRPATEVEEDNTLRGAPSISRRDSESGDE